MVPYNPSAAGVPAPTGGFRARIGNVDVAFASEADYLKADKALREMRQQEMIPTVGGYGGGMGGTSGFVRTGANAAEAVGSFLAGRNIRRKVEDVQDAIDDSRAALAELDALAASGKYPELIPILRRAFTAERDATEAHLGAFEDQLTALDIGAGSGVAKVVADLVLDRPSSPMENQGGGIGTALAVGGAGLGIGLLLSRDNRDDRRSRRR
ncbi:MAG TPA: hypothetical protein PKI03_30090 [Pseudomonadota bacterium]|nr:hypothetical protein [Pseudomonadota bacterium]